MTVIDYDHICRVARCRKKILPANIDWRDLANEAAVRGLMGRKSIDGPITDFLRASKSPGSRRRGESRWCSLPSNLRISPFSDEIIMSRLQSAICALPARSRAILAMRFWFGFEREEIAARIGVVANYAGQLQANALKQLREAIE